MATLPENNATCSWDEGIYQLEATDPVEGGASGVANRQARELALRTRNLHNRLEETESKLEDVETGETAVSTVRGGVSEEYNTLLKLRNWVNQQLQALGGGEELTGAAVRDLLQTLAGDARLDAAYIKNLPDAGGGEELTGVAVRNLLQTLTGDARLDATYIKNIATQITAFVVRDLLQTLTGNARLDAAYVKNIQAQLDVVRSIGWAAGYSTKDNKPCRSIHWEHTTPAGSSPILEVEHSSLADASSTFANRVVSQLLFNKKIAEIESRLTALGG